MKKTLSLVLALVMVLGSFSAAFAAESVTTGAEAGAFLKAAGVLVGDEHGNLNLGDNLSRQDAVILVAQLRGEIKAAQAFAGLPTYEDVKINFYNAPLAWAQENDLFVGHSEKVFGFNEDLTAQEYAKVLLVALGYKVAPNGDSDIKWSEALTKAQEFGILENLKVENATEITRGEMALMTFNALGVNMKGSKKTLAETLDIKMPAPDVLTAKVKDTENLKEIELELSNAKLADKDKLENVNNYKVVDNTVVKAELEGNVVTILLKDALRTDRKYKLRVRSIDRAIDKEYDFTAKDNTIPSVDKVEFAQKYGIRITASEPIKLIDNVKGRNFVVDGKNIAMNVEIYGREIVLTPYHNETFPATADKIIIAGLEDFAGFKSASEEVAIEMIEDKEGPEVVDLILRGYNEVEAVFNKDVYIESVAKYTDRNKVGNISYEVGRQNVYSDNAEKIDTNRVLYSFNEEVYKELLRERTRFTIEGVKNHSGITMDKVTNMVAREVLDNVEPEVVKYEIEEKDVDAKTATVKVFFDKDVEGTLINKNDVLDGFKVKDHFSLYERDVLARNDVSNNVLSAVYDSEVKNGKRVVIKDVVVVELGNLEEWIARNNTDDTNVKYSELNYVLETENFTDVSSKRNKMYRDYFDFQLKRGTDFQLALNGVNVDDSRANETHITLRFTQAVDRATAENLGNYIFNHVNGDRDDVRDLKGRIVTERDGKEVTIILPDFDVNKYTDFRIVDTIKNTDDVRLAHAYTYTFATDAARASIYNGSYTIRNVYNTAGKVVAGEYNIALNTSATKIEIRTNEVATLNITTNYAGELTIIAPKAHVNVNGVTLDNVIVKAIGPASLALINGGKIENLTISTKDVVRVYGNIASMTIFSDVDEAKVILTEKGKLDTAKTIKKNETAIVNADGTLDIDETAPVGAKLQLVNVEKALSGEANKVTTAAGIEIATNGAITVEVTDIKDYNNANVAEMLQVALQKLVGRGYELEITELDLKFKSIEFTVTNADKSDKATSEKILIEIESSVVDAE